MAPHEMLINASKKTLWMPFICKNIAPMKLRSFGILLFILVIGSVEVRAQATWTGGGGDTNWSTSLNWLSDTPPVSSFSSTVLFSGSSPFVSTLDSSYQLDALTVQNGAGSLSLVNASASTLTILGSFTDDSANAVGVNLPLLGSMNLVQNGAGTLTIGGTGNTYSGNTIVTAGTLTDSNPGAFSSASGIEVGAGAILNVGFNETISYLDNYLGSGGSVVLATGVALTINGGFSTTFPGVISGAGGITTSNVGTLTLTGANTYTGPTVIGVNTGINLGGGGAIGSIVSNVSGAGSLSFNTSTNSTYAGTLSGALNVVQQGTGTTTLAGANSYTGPTTVNFGILQAGSASAFGNLSHVTLNGSGILDLNGNNEAIAVLNSSSASSQVTLGSGTLTFGPTLSSSNFAGVISGTGAINYANPNVSVMVLTGANTYSGGTTIGANDTVVLENTTGSGIGTGTVTLAGGVLQIGSLSTNGIPGSQTITGNGTLTFARTDTTSYSNIINGGVSVTVDRGTVSLSGTNAYTGPTTIFDSTLNAGSATALGNLSDVSLSTSATLGLNGIALTIGSLTGDATSFVGLGNGTLTTGGSNNATTFAGSISGTGGLNITGSGSTTLTGTSTYTGGTTVEAGELFLGSSTIGAFGSIISGPVGLGTLTFDDATELSPAADVVLSNAIVLNGGTRIENDDGGTFNMTLTGPVSGTNGFEWCTWSNFALTYNNTFSGGIDMREGTLLLGSDTAAGTGQIILDTGTILSAYGGPGIARNIPNDINLNGSSAQLGNNDGDFITMGGTISGTSSLTYQGGTGGTLTLDGANSGYSGTFTISSGTVIAGNTLAFGPSGNHVNLTGGAGLNVMGGVSVTNPLTFSGTANVLSGNGTISTLVTADSSVIIAPSASPGGGPGNLTFGNVLQIHPGATIDFNLYNATGAAGTGFNLITANAGFDLTTATPGSITFNLSSINASGGSANAINFNAGNSYSWMFATTPTIIAGFNANDFNLVTSGFTNGTGGGAFSFSESGGDQMFLNFTPVPEPSTWALMAAGVLALVPLAVLRRRAAVVDQKP